MGSSTSFPLARCVSLIDWVDLADLKERSDFVLFLCKKGVSSSLEEERGMGSDKANFCRGRGLGPGEGEVCLGNSNHRGTLGTFWGETSRYFQFGRDLVAGG